MSNLKVVTFPERNVKDIPATLRRLADTIEKGEYGEVVNMVWVLDAGHDQLNISLGLIGQSGESAAVAHLLLGAAMRKLEG